jgi:hypothetical protein
MKTAFFFVFQADHIRENTEWRKSIDDKGALLSDKLVECMERYRLYLQGCCLFYKEEDVFGYMNKHCPDTDLSKREKLKYLQWGQLAW